MEPCRKKRLGEKFGIGGKTCEWGEIITQNTYL